MDDHGEQTDENEIASANSARYRAIAALKLNEIAAEAKRVLVEQGFLIDLYFVIPGSGHSILSFGTPNDPDDDQWNKICNIVSIIVQQAVDLDRLKYRDLLCATTVGSAPPPSEQPRAEEQAHAIP